MHESIVLNQICQTFDCLYQSDNLNSVTLNEVRDAFRPSQIKSKLWLLSNISQLLQPQHRIAILGSWFGFIGACLHEMGYSQITDIDQDIRLESLSRSLNFDNKHYVRITADVNDMVLDQFDFVINTSAEHMASDWIHTVKTGSLVAIQTNDIDIPQHVNRCCSLDQVSKQFNVDIIYLDQLKFKTYTRFQLIGIKT